MSSLLPGYEYDIFISYRQKDNKGDKWVTEFVRALKTELDSTFKEDISIYFDENPHDGLLETHHVDKSLEGKLKCLVFIPIISQTYCDPKSFAWKDEFCAFNAMATTDSYGRDIRLGNGNVSSRILPVRIHDLDAPDKALLESELGTALRSVDFIYKAPGVNRPLTTADKKEDNLNKTFYRDQVNKVANAVKEIISAMKSPSSPSLRPATRNTHLPVFKSRRNTWISAILLLAILVSVYYLYPKWVASSEGQSVEKSIAVLPFLDLTPAHDMEYFGDGIADEIINSLTTLKDLKVTGRTSSFQFKNEKVDLRTIGEKLNVAYVLEGSIQKYEDHLRITAQLIRTSDNFHAWSQRFDMTEVNIFKIQDVIAASVVDKLQITLSVFERKQLTKKETNPAAYSEFLKGIHFLKEDRFYHALYFFRRSVSLDPEYAPTYAYSAIATARAIDRTDRDSVKVAIQYATRAIELDPYMPEGYSALGLIAWTSEHEFGKAQEYFEKSIELHPSASYTKNRYGYFLTWMGDFVKASRMAREAQASDPIDYNSYTILLDSAFYNGDARVGQRILSDYARVFGKDGRWLKRSLILTYQQGAYKELSERIDSIAKTGRELDNVELSMLARCYSRLGMNQAADSIVAVLRKMPIDNYSGYYFQLARVFAIQNKVDSCLSNLARSIHRYELQSVSALQIDPDFRHLSKHPRYSELYREMGYDKYRRIN